MKVENMTNKQNELWNEPEQIRWAAWGWDHTTFFRRSGSKNVTFWGNTGWCDKWWNRIHREDTVKMMADLGINMAVTHFFKGMGMEAEKEMLDDLRSLLPLFHKHGIKAIGYTFGTIFYETFLKEEPEAKNWVVKNHDGSNNGWGGVYYRWRPCYNSEGYLNYLKKLVVLGHEIGLDGFHFDNSYSVPCYCETCKALFRQYLTSNIQDNERMGFTGFDHVEPPPPGGFTHDPLIQEWIRFRTDSMAKRMRSLYDFIKSVDPQLLVITNPGFPKHGDWAANRGIDPFQFGKANDLMFAENADFSSFKDDILVHQVKAYKFSEAIGYHILASSWPKDANRQPRLPEKAEEVALSIMEGAIWNQPIALTWALRSTTGHDVAVDDPKRHGSAKHCLDFLSRNSQLFGGKKLPAKVALLHSFESFAYGKEPVLNAYSGFEQLLVQKNINYQLLFTEEIEKASQFDLIIVSNQLCLSNNTCVGLCNYAEKGGKLILTGESGRYNEHLLKREFWPFEKYVDDGSALFWPDQPEFIVTTEEKKWISATSVKIPEKWEMIVSQINALAGPPDIEIIESRAPAIIMTAYMNSHHAVIHLLNYDNMNEESFKIRIDNNRFQAESVKIHDLDNTNIEAIDLIPGNNILTLSVKTYKAIELIRPN